MVQNHKCANKIGIVIDGWFLTNMSRAGRGRKSPEMVAFAARSSGSSEKPFCLALKKRESDFQCRISCTENPCRLGGLGGHDGSVIGHDGPLAILASKIVYFMAIPYAIAALVRKCIMYGRRGVFCTSGRYVILRYTYCMIVN